jgi:hypothetical protein
VDGATGRPFFLCEDGGLIAASMDRATDRFERCLATPAAYGDACMTSLVGRRISDSLLGRVGRWGVTHVPEGWEFADDFGIRTMEAAAPAANIRLSEDTLPAGKILAPYLVAQKTLIGRMFAGPKIAGPSVIAFPGADEAALLFLKHRELDGAPPIIQAQTYVLRENWIGIVTFTATADRFSELKGEYQSFAAGLALCDA